MASSVCDFSGIYNANFSYCVPQFVVAEMYNGTAFGRNVAYSSEEMGRLDQDIRFIYENILEQNPVQEKLALFTAGAPGAGKTNVLETRLKEMKAEGKQLAYIDPDAVCLKNMKLTWEADIGESKEPDVHHAAYAKWRPASNGATHLIAGSLIRDGIGFGYGMTASSPLTKNTFQFLREQGYRVELLHVTAPDDVRWRSIQERDKEFIQTTEQDTCEKGEMVPQRLVDYLSHVDHIDFYYRAEWDTEAVLAATWDAGEKGVLTICNRSEYNQMCQINCAKNSDWQSSLEGASSAILTQESE